MGSVHDFECSFLSASSREDQTPGRNGAGTSPGENGSGGGGAEHPDS